LAPALVNQGPIDYSTANGIKLWRRAGIKSLAKELFTLELHKLFLTTLADWTMTYGWENVLNILIMQQSQLNQPAHYSPTMGRLPSSKSKTMLPSMQMPRHEQHRTT